MNFEEKIIERLKRLEREVERLRVWERPAGGSGVTDHGALTGLSDDDHPQYLLTTGKAADSDKLDGIDSTGFATAGHDHDSDYLGITAKASDSDKLDNIDSTGFVQTSGNQTVGGIKTFTSIPALPATNPTTANQALRKGFADATYLGISAKAADSDKLDNLDSTAFALVGHDHNADYLGISAKAADSDKLDGLDSTDFGRPVFLTAPLISTNWDGDAFSTTAKTKIDLSVVFGVPAGVNAVLVNVALRDSGSAANECLISLSPSSSAGGMTARCSGIANDKFVNACLTVPCDTNGDIYYEISASGTGTMDVYLQIYGYWL